MSGWRILIIIGFIIIIWALNEIYGVIIRIENELRKEKRNE